MSKLSQPMMDALAAYGGSFRNIEVSPRTRAALLSRGLITDDGALTDAGRALTDIGRVLATPVTPVETTEPVQTSNDTNPSMNERQRAARLAGERGTHAAPMTAERRLAAYGGVTRTSAQRRRVNHRRGGTG